jgi:hypothetical protein
LAGQGLTMMRREGPVWNTYVKKYADKAISAKELSREHPFVRDLAENGMFNSILLLLFSLEENARLQITIIDIISKICDMNNQL